ncbi:MAG TPA: sigma-70 family RNA polymerase sigma factor [Vicinamibacterales bacterium]|nr:sigma-70 family RNA polymerase sigma factor [Vicinamibacterales bacterium]
MTGSEAAPFSSPDVLGGHLEAAGLRGRVDSADSRVAREVKALVQTGNLAAARERFADLLALHQRRACRIALAYLNDVADADEAVQDAFVRVFQNIERYREDLPFDQWFTRILINRCIDQQRARARRDLRVVPLAEASAPASRRTQDSPERRLLARQWRNAVSAAVAKLPDRQRAVFTLCQYGGRTPAEVAEVLGMREATVRVHLFRAVHRLRSVLEVWREAR